MKPDRKRPITVEDLLRLKRAERPSAEFWSAFDQKLRAKQLAALVDRRPWWHSLPAVISGLIRPRVVFGTAAALAVVIVVVRENRPSPVGLGEDARLSDFAIAPSQPTPVAMVDIAVDDKRSELSTTAPALIPAAVVVSTLETSPESKGEVALPASTSTVTASSSGDVAPRPALVSFTSVLPAAETKNPARLLALNAGLAHRPASSGRTTIDPLQQMTPPGEMRRVRFSTAMVAQAALDSTSRGAERQANRLVEDGAFNGARRFGARGDRVELKF
ncbi:MAG: hypothetical protein JNK23_19940 [Opitutaceae bacterium]|nr:hypothetical protein [Opitutaceae bacterium]